MAAITFKICFVSMFAVWLPNGCNLNPGEPDFAWAWQLPRFDLHATGGYTADRSGTYSRQMNAKFACPSRQYAAKPPVFCSVAGGMYIKMKNEDAS